jgi:hypothetical protein
LFFFRSGAALQGIVEAMDSWKIDLGDPISANRELVDQQSSTTNKQINLSNSSQQMMKNFSRSQH